MADAERAPAAGAQEPVAPLACPFCGSADVDVESDGFDHAVACARCGARGGYSRLADGAVESWNERAAPAPQVAAPSGVDLWHMAMPAAAWWTDPRAARWKPHRFGLICGVCNTVFGGPRPTCQCAVTNPGGTHYDGCWREHHACAVAVIERGQTGGVPPHLNAVFDFMEGRLDAPALEDELDAAVSEQDEARGDELDWSCPACRTDLRTSHTEADLHALRARIRAGRDSTPHLVTDYRIEHGEGGKRTMVFGDGLQATVTGGMLQRRVVEP